MDSDWVIAKVLGVVSSVLGLLFVTWRRISRTRTDNAEDTSRRTHMDTLEREAREAREEAHRAATKVADLSSKVGELSGQVELYKELYRSTLERLKAVEDLSALQTRQIQRLMQGKGLESNWKPNDS